MFTMYDSVTLDKVPANPHAVACYVNGRYANEAEARKRFPHARILTISVEGQVPSQCYDIENGDYHTDQAGELFKIAQHEGIWRPCFYADLSNMPAVRASLNEVIKARDEVRLWVAAYDGLSIIPAGYDAHQFTCTALGRNLDESICESTFFKATAKPPTVEPAPDKTATVTVEYNETKRTWAIK